MTSVNIRVLDVPEMAQVGHTVHMTCDYDLERQRLYQVKWYKGTHEFYRYSPGEPVKQKVFLVKNLNIDVSYKTHLTFSILDEAVILISFRFDVLPFHSKLNRKSSKVLISLLKVGNIAIFLSVTEVR